MNGKLSYEGKINEPDLPTLKAAILCCFHNCPLVGHQGSANIYNLLAKDFHWLEMLQFTLQ